MPLESIDYDVFEYGDPVETQMSLEEAAARIAELRRLQPDLFHKLAPSNSDLTEFHVESVSRDEVEQAFKASIAQRWLKFIARARR
jgi:hypothetical protein